jgi:hypothetical protein
MPPLPFIWIDSLLYDKVPGLKELDVQLGAVNIPPQDAPSYNQSLYLINLTKEGANPHVVKQQYITQLEGSIVLSNTAVGSDITALYDQKIALLEEFLGIKNHAE